MLTLETAKQESSLETETVELEENGGNEENEEIFQVESPEGEENSNEKIVVLPDEEEFDDVLRNGPPSTEFAEFFKSIPTDETNENAMEYLCNFAWSQYTDAGRQVDMEGEAKAWMACSIFLSMIKKKLSPVSTHVFTIRNLQISSGVSIIELFDKLERYTETVSNSKKIKEQIQKVQGSLAVAAVVYKKLLPIYRGIFLEMDETSSAAAISSYDLLKSIWTMFCLLKKHLKQEDLLNSYNLLLCVIELVYEWICKQELDKLVNSEFSEKFLSSDCSILEFLCRTFGGAVLDAKHFKQHIFNEMVVSVLNFEGSGFFGNQTSFVKKWESDYEDLLRKRAELDERMFLPTEKDFGQVFDENFDGSAVELLRRGPDDTKFADVELLLRMSTQNCLEKLMDNKKNGPNASKSYILSSDNLFPTTPLTTNGQNTTKLIALVPEGYNVAGSQLEVICEEMKESPLPIIASHIEYFAQLFSEKVTSEAEEQGKNYDAEIYKNLSKLTDFVKDLSYTIIERIMKAEREKRTDSETDLCNVYQKEEFLQSIVVCVLELVLFCYNSKRDFPWSIDLLNLEPICFQKAIQLVVRALPELSREMVKHLNKKEEEVLEEIGWTDQSPIWLAINKNPGCVPSCDVAWKQPKMLAEKYSPVKRMRLEDGRESPARPVASSITLVQFVGKVYFLACGRLNDLCDRVKITEIGKRMCWTLLDHVLRNETSLMLNRHLDQNLLCVVYAVAKYIMIPCTFMDLIAHYRHQPQAQSYIYREINVDSSAFGTSPSDDGNSRDSTSNPPIKLRCGSTIPTSADSFTGSPGPSNCEKVDLIIYYNKVFLQRVESFVKTLETAQDKLIPMPKTASFGSLPMKRTIGERFQVNVTSLNSSSNNIERRFKYNVNQSPRKELQAINQMVNTGHSSYFEHDSPDQKVYTTSFRR